MHEEEREDRDHGLRDVRICILADGSIVMPRGTKFLDKVAEEVGDPTAVTFCKQAEMTKVIFGKRMCG